MTVFIICLLATVLIGYLIGSANTAILVGKAYGIDIRTKGSGNAGMTNVMRTLGSTAGILVIIGDALKAVISCLIGYFAVSYFAPSYAELLPGIGSLTGAFAVIAGHIWPVYFHFKGGKGVLTAVCALLTIDYKPALVSLAIFFVIMALTRYVSLGSILGTASFPFTSVLFKGTIEWWYFIFTLTICILIVYMHKGNISRLIKGTESKVGRKKTVGTEAVQTGSNGGERA